MFKTSAQSEVFLLVDLFVQFRLKLEYLASYFLLNTLIINIILILHQSSKPNHLNVHEDLNLYFQSQNK